MSESQNITISLVVTKEIKKQLNEESIKQKRTPSNLMRLIFSEYLEK